MILCDYNCGQEANHNLNNKWCCSIHRNKCPEIRRKNSEGLKVAHQVGKKGYTFNPNSIWSKGKTSISDSRIRANQSSFEEIFCENSPAKTDRVKKIIIQENLLEYKCAICKINKWLEDELSLELDHENGDRTDNRLENLRFLCPNCHSQTPGWRGRNSRISPNEYITDDEFITTLKSTKSIRQALLKLGLAAKGGNYERAKKLLKTMPE